ncbi:single-stranded-DNA-specific exonuclease RecJ [Staphylococcus massiliensis]|uniref:Single-stranded-DNA-specific exonuclease RecJ n=1 Tax=Staphylococcus massiliensis S46 TaxID=1229783 RepID=K9ARS3_9STAP|nr:single-stranded-DNA-specific exonuclease RecJ [Staphylococcus massiliensis]EKU49974.1 single-stranded-DNA-specific exonuclease RecJ [Staphylococcus massiliensis S46]POA01760.1 single-stranded-DNA-specific exonuclease RecJ [Staphylococcus massiliensis CCUG 55927]
MIKSKFVWDTKFTDNQIPDEVSTSLNLTPIVKKVLESKHITDADSINALFKSKDIDHAPTLMSDMDKAVERINEAIESDEKILVYGDYDADGVTSTTIMVKTLSSLGAEVGYYIPNRFTEGYGPNKDAFMQAYEEGVNLIITVDNGIQGHDEIDMIQELGVDVIVTDHHEIGETLPNAFAIVHPMHESFNYPFKYLCGAGVAYKVAQALIDHPPQSFLALAAIGTIADLVSLTDENRAIVQKGLEVLNQHCPVAIEALLNQANYKDDINEETIGFIIGPRLNAVGRLDDASLALELLMTEDIEEASFLAEQVDAYNVERKDVVQSIYDEASVIAEEKVQSGRKFILLAQEGWHEGVLGIVASRIVEMYNLPTLILNIDIDQNHAKGSARSIEQVSMFDCLSENQSLISKFGGHHMAAGMTLPIENIDELEAALDAYVQKLSQQYDLSPKKTVDIELEESDITVENIQDIERLRPFGTDFNAPLIRINNIRIRDSKAIGQEKRHLKLTLGERSIQALFWNQGQLSQEMMTDESLSFIGKLQANEWNGNKNPQVILEDLKSDHIQVLDYRSKNKVNQLKQIEDELAFFINDSEDKFGDNYYYYGEAIDKQYDKCVFRDLPNTLDDFKATLKLNNVSQIYLILKHHQSIYFDGMPHMSSFKNCYKAIYAKKRVNLEDQGMMLCEYLRIKPNELKFILKVFLELQFIKEENGIIEIVPLNEKKDIQSSKIYQKREQRIMVEKHLLYQDFDSLKKWILNELA